MSRPLHDLQARDVMSTDLQWTTQADNLLDAGRRMAEHGLRSLLVHGERPTDLPGIVTSKDIVNLLGSQDVSALDAVTVADVMTRPAICVGKDVHLVDCVNLMRMSGVRRMPVLDGVKVLGILSSSDVFARALGG